MRKRIPVYDDSFKQELVEIIKYISFELKNPSAAERLSNAVKYAILKRCDFPGTFEPYQPTKPLKFTYYRIYVGNYTVFYYFKEHEMHISHIFYSAANIKDSLK